jgi:hypothetical protein
MSFTSSNLRKAMAGVAIASGLQLVLALSFASGAAAQERTRRLEPGTIIPVRADEAIDSRAVDHRIYTGFVTNDVRNDNGRLVVPAGSRVELEVRALRDNDLRLDLVSVLINGQRYGIQTAPKHVEAREQAGLVGGIVGALTNGEVSGREVRIPRQAVMQFRLDAPLFVGIADPGYEREGHHYHHEYDDDYYRGRDER